jgi:hypothetical protein
MAVTMPGMYDLLPFFSCVDEGATARRLAPQDIAAFGGDAELAAEATERHTQRMQGGSDGLSVLIGVEQGTSQSVRISSGAVRTAQETLDVDADGRILARSNRYGDSTVPRRAAGAWRLSPMTLSQSHGALPAAEAAAQKVRDVLLNTDSVPLGETQLGFDVPDHVLLSESLQIVLHGTDPGSVTCRIENAATGQLTGAPAVIGDSSHAVATQRFSVPGVYRVQARSGGASAVTQLVMVLPDAAGLDEVS